MAIDKELFCASHGLKYPVVARPYTDDMEVKEKFFTKADMVAILDKVRNEINKIYEREGSSFDCLNALDELKEFIDKLKTERGIEDGKHF